jgi:hypothetical protein
MPRRRDFFGFSKAYACGETLLFRFVKEIDSVGQVLTQTPHPNACMHRQENPFLHSSFAFTFFDMELISKF